MIPREAQLLHPSSPPRFLLPFSDEKSFLGFKDLNPVLLSTNGELMVEEGEDELSETFGDEGEREEVGEGGRFVELVFERSGRKVATESEVENEVVDLDGDRAREMSKGGAGVALRREGGRRIRGGRRRRRMEKVEGRREERVLAGHLRGMSAGEEQSREDDLRSGLEDLRSFVAGGREAPSKKRGRRKGRSSSFRADLERLPSAPTPPPSLPFPSSLALRLWRLRPSQ